MYIAQVRLDNHSCSPTHQHHPLIISMHSHRKETNKNIAIYLCRVRDQQLLLALTRYAKKTASLTILRRTQRTNSLITVSMSDKLRGEEGVRERERGRQADRQRDRDGGGTGGVCKKTDKLTYTYMYTCTCTITINKKGHILTSTHFTCFLSPFVEDQTLLQAPQRMNILPNTALKRRTKCLME